MILLKVASIFYISLMLIFFICLDCKTKQVEESVGFKILIIFQALSLAYAILN